MHRRYGLWLLSSPRAFEDPHVRRETRESYERPAQFQRAVGVRYSRGMPPRFPNSKGGYGAFGPYGPPRSIAQLLKGWFSPKPVPTQRMALRPGYRTHLANATGY